MTHLGADILGLVSLQNRAGKYFLLETNDIPRLPGFPDSVRNRLAARQMAQLA